MAKFVDMKPERFGIELAPGGNILPVMNAWKQFAGTEGGIYYYYDFPKNAMNDWLKAEYQKRFNAPPDFFVAGGFAAASAVVAALQKAGSTDTEKLIAAMEGLTFDTPKGPDDLPQGGPSGAAGHVPLPHQEGRQGQRRPGAGGDHRRPRTCRFPMRTKR